MLTFLRRFLILVLGLALLVLPMVVRDLGWRFNERNYTAPDVPELNFSATPAPTPTAMALPNVALGADDELRRGSVVVDFAHFSFLNPANLQPLSDALADRGLGLRYWISIVDTMALESSAQFPDQSAELAAQLKDASALVVISPFFLWTQQEIAVAERFVADGGRLLLISDPDIMGDFPSLVNILAEPFGVVFHDDYLYDTARNDGNFTFFFVESAPEQEGTDANPTNELADATIAFYGGRSISGNVVTQMRSVDSALSSIRTGQSGFTTVAIGGVAGRGTAGRVLALSDFDVLTEAYRVRHDNQRMVDYVADFLSADQRIQTMPDFPNYLGKTVALSYGARSAIDANLLAQGAKLQQRLEETGRTLTLTNGHALSNSAEAGDADATDLIYLADYSTTLTKTTLLTDLGVTIITEAVTITVPVEVTPVDAKPTASSSESSTESASDNTENSSTLRERSAVTATIVPTATPIVTLTVTPIATPTVIPVVTPTATPAIRDRLTANEATENTPNSEPLTVTAAISTSDSITTPMPQTRVVITTYLETADGLRFLADETVLVAQVERDNGTLLLAVLGADRRGIDAGVARLLANDFKDCVIGTVMTFCSLPPVEAPSRSSGGSTPSQTDESTTGTADSSKDTGSGSKPATPPAERTGILLIDDNRAAGPSEQSEADLYLQALIGAEHSVDLWSAGEQGTPTAEDMSAYAWVIWSNGGYANGKLSIEDMDIVFGYVRLGGRLTISSRFPLPGLEEPSTVRDVVADTAIPELVDGLPDGPIALAAEQTTANLAPLAADESGVQIALRRGPDSENAEAPLMVVMNDAATAESGSRFMLVGVGLNGLPETVSAALIKNMATWMRAD